MARPECRLRLFCLPFAGGGASAFNAWPGAFPDTVELHAVQLPGRESRYGEASLSDVHEAAGLIADAMQPYLDRPYVVYGYSMGALISFEVIRELRGRGAPLPGGLFVGARRAPHLAANSRPLAELPREEFLEQVRRYYDPPVALWQDPDLLGLILPVLRADLSLCERYVYRPGPPFDFWIQAFGGSQDRSAPLPVVQAWHEQTTGEFALEAFEGAHFFVNTHLRKMQQIMFSRLEPLMSGAASSLFRR